MLPVSFRCLSSDTECRETLSGDEGVPINVPREYTMDYILVHFCEEKYSFKVTQCINTLQLERANCTGCAGFCSSPALTHLIQCINPLQLERANRTGCAGFCSSPALTHLIQCIKPNELIIRCDNAGLEQKSVPPVDQWCWTPLVLTFFFCSPEIVLVITAYVLLKCLTFYLGVSLHFDSVDFCS